MRAPLYHSVTNLAHTDIPMATGVVTEVTVVGMAIPMEAVMLTAPMVVMEVNMVVVMLTDLTVAMEVNMVVDMVANMVVDMIRPMAVTEVLMVVMTTLVMEALVIMEAMEARMVDTEDTREVMVVTVVTPEFTDPMEVMVALNMEDMAAVGEAPMVGDTMIMVMEDTIPTIHTKAIGMITKKTPKLPPTETNKVEARVEETALIAAPNEVEIATAPTMMDTETTVARTMANLVTVTLVMEAPDMVEATGTIAEEVMVIIMALMAIDTGMVGGMVMAVDMGEGMAVDMGVVMDMVVAMGTATLRTDMAPFMAVVLRILLVVKKRPILDPVDMAIK